VGRYRARDLLLAPNLLSLARVPLAAAFVGRAHRPPWALAVLMLAGVTDVLDGYLARRLGQATPTGAVVDGVLDKVFAATVIGSLIAQGHLSWLQAGLLVVREVAELPLVVWWALHEDSRCARADDPRANWVGKGATVCQFAAIGTLLLRGQASTFWLSLAGVVGAASAVAYWRRELQGRVRRHGTERPGAPGGTWFAPSPRQLERFERWNEGMP
jgi:CDP-diacylglycerol--glycerol-3-phosphate 3-phosphatidyltransferase/cardiolipin synthase